MYIYDYTIRLHTMTKKLIVGKRIHCCIVILICIVNLSCAPKINSFTVNKRMIGPADTLAFKWDVKGQPTLLYHERSMTSPGTPDSAAVRYLQFTLLVERNGREPKKKTLDVLLQPANSTDSIVCATQLSGDTLVASCIKDTLRWGKDYQVVTARTGSGRSLKVTHDGKTSVLDAAGTASHLFEGTTVSGAWRISSLLSASEKADMSTAAEKLTVIVTIQRKTL